MALGMAGAHERDSATRALNVVTIVCSIAHLVLFITKPALFDAQFARVGFCATDQGWLHTLEYTFAFQLAAVVVILGLARAYPSSDFSAGARKQVPGILFHALAHLAQVREVPVISFFTKSMAANNEHSVCGNHFDNISTIFRIISHHFGPFLPLFLPCLGTTNRTAPVRGVPEVMGKHPS